MERTHAHCTTIPSISAMVLNAALPGTGLIMLRRPVLGTGLAVLFVLGGHALIAATLFAPARFDPLEVRVVAGAVVGTWLVAQVALWRSLRTLLDPGRRAQLQVCYDLADDAWRERRIQDARGALGVALTVDDENPHTYARIARLNGRSGRPREARRAWRRVGQLDRDKRYLRERHEALSALDGRSTA